MTQEEARKAWINALRSGRYEQGWGALRFEDQFCCLGVACDVLKDEVSLEVNKKEYNVYSYNGFTGCLPHELVDLLGLISGDGIPKDPDNHELTHLNDNVQLTFEEIADCLESGEYWK